VLVNVGVQVAPPLIPALIARRAGRGANRQAASLLKRFTYAFQ
jgi:hypothetical protein